MHAAVGERLVIHGRKVGSPDQEGQIVEVRGPDGEPPYLVKFDDGHERLVYPGPDSVVHHQAGPRD